MSCGSHWGGHGSPLNYLDNATLQAIRFFLPIKKADGQEPGTGTAETFPALGAGGLSLWAAVAVLKALLCPLAPKPRRAWAFAFSQLRSTRQNT